MSSNDEMRDVALARLLPFGPVAPRAMFGGFGLFLDGTMFALIARGRLWFKVDAMNRPDYQALDAEPFSYDGPRGPVIMSYSEVPETILADTGRLTDWAEKAHGAARRAKAGKNPRTKRSVAGD